MPQELELLHGKHILIVEDGVLIADQARGELERRGVRIVGPVSSVRRALDLLDAERVDAAILDIDLDGETVFPLADALIERGISFVFATGCERSPIRGKCRGFLLSDKPAELAVIAIALFSPERFQPDQCPRLR